MIWKKNGQQFGAIGNLYENYQYSDRNMKIWANGDTNVN